MTNSRRLLERAIYCVVLSYGLLVLVFSFSYPRDARLFPLVVGPAAVLIGVVSLSISWWQSTHAVERTDDNRTNGPTKVATSTMYAEPSAGDFDEGVQQAAAVQKLPVWLRIGLVGMSSLALIFFFGIYVYAFIFPMLFVRLYGRASRSGALAFGLAVGVFVYGLIGRILGAPLDRVGGIALWWQA